MKKFGVTVNSFVKFMTKSWRTVYFSQGEGPSLQFCRTTTNKRFGTTSVATQQLLTECPDRPTRFSVQCRQNRTLFVAMVAEGAETGVQRMKLQN